MNATPLADPAKPGLGQPVSPSALGQRIARLAERERRTRRIMLWIYSTLVLLMASYCLFAPGFIARSLQPDSAAELIMSQVESVLPSDEEMVRRADAFIVTQTSRYMDRLVEALPELRRTLLVNLADGLNRSSSSLHGYMSRTLSESMQQRRLDLRQALGAYQQREALEQLALDLASDLNGQMDYVFSRHLRLHESITQLRSAQTSRRTEKERAQRELLICAHQLVESEEFSTALAEQLTQMLQKLL